MDSAPEAPYKSPITKERVEFMKTKPYKGTTINVMVLKATVGDGLKYHVPHWEEETGGKVNVAEVPIETLHQQIFSDLASGLGRYDAYMTGAWFYGDFFVPEKPYIVPIESSCPIRSIPIGIRTRGCRPCGSSTSGAARSTACSSTATLRRSTTARTFSPTPTTRTKFKDKFGYDLPAPPKTMKELHDCADFFTGWDWNGDGKQGWGLALHAKVNEQGFFHFLSLSAPYVISPDNKYYFFDPDMKPLINSEGHLRALEDYVKLAKNGPREEISWTLGQGWNLFLAGNSAMEPTWGDLPTLAQDPKTSKVQGKIGAAGIPGTTEAFNPITGEWKKYDLNQVGNTNGGSWHCVISSLSKNQEATYDFLAFMANKKNAFFNAANGWTGVQPGMKFEYLPPVGSATLDEFKAQGWNDRRRDGVPEGLLFRPQRTLAAAISAHPGGGRILARARRQRLGGSRRPDGAEGGARRHRRGLGEDHRPLRPRQAEDALRGFVRVGRSLTDLRRPAAQILLILEAGEAGMAAAAVRHREYGSVFKYVLLLPAVLWVIAFTFLPLISVIRYSFANYVLGQGITGYVGFANYVDVLTSNRFWHSIVVTAIYVVVTVPIEVILGFLAAWLVNLGAPWSRGFRTIIGLPLFTLEVAIGYLGVTMFSSQGGMIDSLLGLVGIHIPWLSTPWGGITAAIILDIWRWTSFVFLIALAALSAISSDLYDAAILDAKSHWPVMWRLGVPLAWPVMTIAILLRTIECLKVFAIPFALTTGGPGTSTEVFSAMDYLTTIQFFDFGKGSAMGIIFLIMVAVIITIFFKQMRKALD